MALVQPQSDVAALWQEALEGYKKVTDIDLLGRSATQRSVNSIMVSNALVSLPYCPRWQTLFLAMSSPVLEFIVRCPGTSTLYTCSCLR
jgi:hypothetical protein